MLSKSAITTLIEIRFNIVLIEDLVGGFSSDAFERELKTVFATTRALEIISEASRRLPDDLKDRHPAIPWAKMRSADNTDRQDYESVDGALIWRPCTKACRRSAPSTRRNSPPPIGKTH